MSIKIENKLKVHGESTAQKYTDAQYASETQRVNGVQPGTPVGSKVVNTGLRQATLVTAAFIEALKTIVPNDNDLITAITVGSDTTLAQLTNALIDGLVKIKVSNATTADNVKSGAIVEETERARLAQQGYGISLLLNEKLTYKSAWLGEHKNNDVLYYGVAGALKGFYIVKGLPIETKTNPAGIITIVSGQSPTNHSTNLVRLTFETAIGTDTNLTKTDTVSVSSTTNELATAKALYDEKKQLEDDKQDKITAGQTTHILTKTTTKGQVGIVHKKTELSSASSDNDIPTAKAVYDYVNDRKWQLIRDTSTWVAISGRSKTSAVSISTTVALSVGEVIVLELAGSSLTDRPLLVQTVVTKNSTNPALGNVFIAEYLKEHANGQTLGSVNQFVVAKHFVYMSYSEGTNLRFMSVGKIDTVNDYQTTGPVLVDYAKSDYDNVVQDVKSKGSATDELLIRRVWRIR